MKVQRIVEDRHGENEWPPDDYTGVWEIYWRKYLWLKGGLKSRGEYKDGKEEGEQTCYWKNGRIAQNGKMVQGQCVGLWTDFDEDGSKALEGVFGPEGKDGVWRSFWSGGMVMKEEFWRSGQQHGSH